jgi:hypothetical protein
MGRVALRSNPIVINIKLDRVALQSHQIRNCAQKGKPRRH